MNVRRNGRKGANNTVEEQSVAKQILDALADFTDALEKGEVPQRLRCRQLYFDFTPAVYTPRLVKQARNLIRVSQPVFASLLGVSAKTVRSWEQGASTPSPMARRFMDEIRRAPDYWAGRLREAVTVASGEAGDAAGKRR